MCCDSINKHLFLMKTMLVNNFLFNEYMVQLGFFFCHLDYLL
jgi:hypothetical protein